MGVAANMLPEQENIIYERRRRIPPDMVEEILLNLPVKSLLRFSSVSKSWNSMIFDSRFIRRHRSRATLPGRERMAIRHPTHGSGSLSSISPNHLADNATPLICRFEMEGFGFLASCGELWCVEHAGSLFLWNPSMRTYKKLPNPFVQHPFYYRYRFMFGIGYDSIRDDYKILKISEVPYTYIELYSLRSDSWKKIQPYSGKKQRGRIVFVSGAFNWLCFFPDHAQLTPPHNGIIVSFNLSTEKYGEVVQPPYDPVPRIIHGDVDLIVLRGMLCLYLNYHETRKFVFWVMQDYGVEKSWTKMFEIDYCRVVPHTQLIRGIRNIRLTPLYFYGNAKILIKVRDSIDDFPTKFMYIVDGESIPQIVFSSCYVDHGTGLLYVESLVSPETYCGP